MYRVEFTFGSVAVNAAELPTLPAALRLAATWIEVAERHDLPLRPSSYLADDRILDLVGPKSERGRRAHVVVYK